jgi:integrase
MPKTKKRPTYKRELVKVAADRGSLRLRFTFEKKQQSLSLGLTDTPANRFKAQEIASRLTKDLEYGVFDPKNSHQYKTTTAVKPSKLALSELWLKYSAYKASDISPTTAASSYRSVDVCLAKVGIDGLADPLGFRDRLKGITTPRQVKNALQYLSAACRWGMKHGLVSSDPFAGMAVEIKQPEPAPPVAFSKEEVKLIIAGFQDHKVPRGGYSHRFYVPFVKFLFLTGCRPCEAIGLRWGSVAPGCERLHFYESIVLASNKLVRREETKTGKRRWFTCLPDLAQMLGSIRPESPGDDDLVFPSPRNGGPIRLDNFSQGPWKAVMEGVGLGTKNGQTMTPYNARDTFITLQLAAGVSDTVVAAWVGNSPDVIRKRYLDPSKLEAIAPREIY